MTFLEFSDKWADENVPVTAGHGYRTRECVKQMAKAFADLRVGNLDFAWTVLKYFWTMFSEYSERQS